MDDPARFTVTDDHLTLLRRYYPSRDDFGNWDWRKDIAGILGWELFTDQYGDKHFTEEQAKEADRLHRQVRTALEIALRVGAFEAGEYEQPDSPFGDWRRVETE